MARRKPQVCKVDQNHAQIVEELRLLGLSVSSIAKVANGAPDIIVGVHGRNFLFEIKRQKNKSGAPEDLTDKEKEWHRNWKGQVTIVTNVLQVLEVMHQDFQQRGQPFPPPLMSRLVL